MVYDQGWVAARALYTSSNGTHWALRWSDSDVACHQTLSVKHLCRSASVDQTDAPAASASVWVLRGSALQQARDTQQPCVFCL